MISEIEFVPDYNYDFCVEPPEADEADESVAQ
jgi:hypothetical protein